MPFASIDLGSNTFLLTIVDGSRILLDEVRYVRLQEGLKESKVFSQDALNRAESTLKEFADLLKEYKVSKVQAVATSATRQSKNGYVIVDICQRLNIPIEIISGIKEAELTFLGAHFFYQPSQYHWVIDIGGGSTEIILGLESQILWRHSFSFGCVGLQNEFDRQVDQIEFKIKNEFMNQISKFDFKKNLQIIAVAGTPTEMVRLLLKEKFTINQVEGFILKFQDIRAMYNLVISVSPEQLVTEYQVPEKRADVLLQGVVILKNFFEFVDASEVYVSRSGIRFGVLKTLMS